ERVVMTELRATNMAKRIEKDRIKRETHAAFVRDYLAKKIRARGAARSRRTVDGYLRITLDVSAPDSLVEFCRHHVEIDLRHAFLAPIPQEGYGRNAELMPEIPKCPHLNNCTGRDGIFLPVPLAQLSYMSSTWSRDICLSAALSATMRHKSVNALPKAVLTCPYSNAVCSIESRMRRPSFC